MAAPRPPRRGAPGKRTGKRSGTPGAGARGAGKGAQPGGRRGADQRGRRQRREQRDERAGPKTWGNVARRGAGRVRDDQSSGASTAFRRAAGLQPALGPHPGAAQPPAPLPAAEWRRVDDEDADHDNVRARARRAVARGRSAPAPRRAAPREVADDLAVPAAGAPPVPKFAERLREASRAFDRERFTEARKLLKPLAERAPGTAVVRELYGLTLYRLGQWRAAAKELEAFRTLTG